MRINNSSKLTGLVWLAVLFISNISFAAATKVELYPANVQLSYPQPVRLVQVLHDAKAHVNFAPYWHGAKLFDVEKQLQTDQLVTSVKQELSDLQHEYPDKKIYQSLLNQLSKYQFGYRQSVTLDPDLVRLEKQFNPGMPGHYVLQLSPRPESVLVMGGVKKIVSVPFTPTMGIADYLKQSEISFLDGTNSSFAWIIYPDGQSRKVGYAYWNNQKALLIPGSILYLGFSSDNHQHNLLESNIIHLLGAIKGSL